MRVREREEEEERREKWSVFSLDGTPFCFIPDADQTERATKQRGRDRKIQIRSKKREGVREEGKEGGMCSSWAGAYTETEKR